MENIFLDITVVVGLAAILSVVFRIIKQPVILAYILAGILIGPLHLFGFFHIENTETMHGLAQIGITLLLFILGLELKIADLKSVGKVALLTGIGQILFTSILGYMICLSLGFSSLTSFYISIALTFSSTIIIVKLLSDKKDLNSLYGKISVGFLLVQDFCAIIALIFLSGFTTPNTSVSLVDFLILSMKAIVLFGWMIVFSKTLLPKILNKIAKSPEVLFIFSLAWAFGIAAFVSSPFIGFSIEIGGFLAGIALGNTIENFQIAARIRSLRDFFITIFFVTLGMSMSFASIREVFLPAMLLSAFVLIGNPIIVMIVLGLLGYRRRTSFLAGLTVAQISEFSMIVIFMGNKIGHVSDQIISLVTIVGAVTFVVSSYMILNGNKLYLLLFPLLGIFERKKPHEQNLKNNELRDHVILVGANRMGESILDALIKSKEDVAVVDFDPSVVSRLQGKGITCMYGDIADMEIQEMIHIDKAKLIISTVPDLEDNLVLLEGIRKRKKRALVVVFALEADDAKELYDSGADYVVLPHLAGGRHLAKMIVDKNHLELIEDYKKKDISFIT